MTHPLAFRIATEQDIPLLAQMNKDLIKDEGHSNPMSVEQLAQRMMGFLSGGYGAVLFEQGGIVVAYALYRSDDDGIYLRHFFVRRDCRRHGLGQAAMAILLDDVWPQNARITVEVLTDNVAGRAFWSSIGFIPYSLALEMTPEMRSGRE